MTETLELLLFLEICYLFQPSVRILWRAAAGLIIVLVLLYALDGSVFQLRRAWGGGMDSVAVDRFLATTLKGNKIQLDYLGTVNQSCSRSLFPQYAASQWNAPCWWLRRHHEHWDHL